MSGAGSMCLLVLLALANFGVLIWGSVLVFSNGQYGASRAGDYSQCAKSLYDPASAALIAIWVFGAVFGCMLRPTKRNDSSTSRS